MTAGGMPACLDFLSFDPFRLVVSSFKAATIGSRRSAGIFHRQADERDSFGVRVSLTKKLEHTDPSTMPIWQSLAKEFFEALGILTLVALSFEATLRVCQSGFCKSLMAGILFGLGGSASMMIPNEITPGIFFDMRHVFIVLSAPFGGWIATAITAVATGLTRIYLGGIGLTVGLVGIGISAAASLVMIRVVPFARKALWSFPLYGLCASLPLVSLAILPLETALSLIQSAGTGLIIANLIGVVAGAHMLSYQQRRIEHEHDLAAEAKIDALTGLLNRRAFDERTAAMAAKAHDRRKPTSVMMIDIDNFKRINDTFGHAAGDQILRSIGQTILRCARGTDVVARYGGEEFALMLTGATDISAKIVSSRIHAAIERTPHELGGAQVHVTVSIGVCALERLGDRPLSVALEKADAALYDAKRAGRNQTVFAEAA